MSSDSEASTTGVRTEEEEAPVEAPSKQRKTKKKQPAKKQDQEIAGDAVLVLENLEDIVTGMGKAASACASEFTGKKEKTQILKKFHDHALSVTRDKIKISKIGGVIDKTYQRMNLDVEAMTDADFFEMLEKFEKEAIKDCEKIKVIPRDLDNDSSYQNFLEAMHELGDKTEAPPSPPGAGVPDSQEGIEALTEHVYTRDPLTKKLFVDPRVNSKCGHVYEFENVKWIVSTGKCPYPSCPHKVAMKNIVNDADMARKIKQKIQEEEIED